MLCERCKQNTATTHYRQVINGQESQINLCGKCASEMGVGKMLNPFAFDISQVIGQVFGQQAGKEKSMQDMVRCPGCGGSFQDIVHTGKTGCAQCYTTFYQQVLPSIQRIHGKTEHIGKISAGAGEHMKARAELKKYKEELGEAIERQDFERAAQLRDAIRDLEQGGGQQ